LMAISRCCTFQWAQFQFSQPRLWVYCRKQTELRCHGYVATPKIGLSPSFEPFTETKALRSCSTVDTRHPRIAQLAWIGALQPCAKLSVRCLCLLLHHVDPKTLRNCIEKTTSSYLRQSPALHLHRANLISCRAMLLKKSKIHDHTRQQPRRAAWRPGLTIYISVYSHHAVCAQSAEKTKESAGAIRFNMPKAWGVEDHAALQNCTFTWSSHLVDVTLRDMYHPLLPQAVLLFIDNKK